MGWCGTTSSEERWSFRLHHCPTVETYGAWRVVFAWCDSRDSLRDLKRGTVSSHSVYPEIAHQAGEALSECTGVF